MTLKNIIADDIRTGNLRLIIPTFFICLLSLALPLLTIQVYDRILPNPDSGTLPMLVAFVCAAIVLDTMLRLARAYVLGWNGASFEHRLSCGAIKHVIQSDLAVIGRDGTGENLNRMAAINKLREFHNGYDVVTYTELSFAVVYLGLMAYISGPLVLVPLAVLTFFGLISLHQGRGLKKALYARDVADDCRYNFLIESLRGIHTLKSFCIERLFQRRYEHMQYKATVANYAVTESAAGIFNTGNLFSHIMLAGVITCGAWLVLNGSITSGVLIAAILLSGRVMQPVQRALGLWARYQDYRIASAKVQELLTMPLTPSESRITAEPERKGILQLSKVSFRKEETGTYLFRDVNLRLQRGQSVQISGAYGCGKSTLLRIMAGLYPPVDGRVEVDTLNPLDYKPQALMTHIGLLPTQGAVFRGRIRDNLTRFGAISEDDVRPIAAMMGIEQEISRLPRGFDTWMDGTDQDAVPPGLRQRIAIVRVLAARPRIILFDNADRNLDRDGYRLMHAMLGRLKDKVALVMVTEDKNLSRLADRHMIMTETGLVEIDPSDESEHLIRELRA